MMTQPIEPILADCGRLLLDKKVEHLKIIDLKGKSTITDYFIMATATSHPHLRALCRELEAFLDQLHIKPLGIDYQPLSGWLVIDAFDFMIHIFLAQQREYYSLDLLWRDGVELALT